MALCLSAAPLGATAEPVTIVAMGDSLTQGFGLVPEAGFVPQLERWLTAKGAEVELLNAGVSGDTTAGGLARVNWSLDDNADAMILALGANDVLRGIAPEVARANLAGILDAAAARDLPVLLVGVVAPPNYGPDYKRAFDVMYPELAETYGTLYFQDFLFGVTSLPDRAAALAKYIQPDGLHPNADGVALVVDAMGPSVLNLVERAQNR
ncbi:MAG: arylesterase [Pseudomonadota bacterium]